MKGVVLRAPFPWFGGKSRAAGLIWSRLGDVSNYVEPFFGGGAVLLQRPHVPRAETVNDLDCYVANFWRAMQADRAALARLVDWPVNEADLHARHLWLVQQGAFQERMKTDKDYYDVQVAAWWCWGICQWIGSGWCHWRDGEQGPRHGQVWRKRLCLRRGGKGVLGQGLWRARPGMVGNGVHRQLPDISGDSGAFGRGVHRCGLSSVEEWFDALSARLRRVRVCCGDFERVLGASATYKIGLTGVLLDPPYGSGRDGSLYRHDSFSVAERARAWALANGDHPKLRIALCGLEGEHAMPSTWTRVTWKANGGYGNAKPGGRGRRNAGRETIWFSPHCLGGER